MKDGAAHARTEEQANRSALVGQTPVPQDGWAVGNRVRVRGKFLYSGDEKLLIRGVTYGPFQAGPDGCEYHDPDTVARDFAAMNASGFNAVRTYTVPPTWLLDLAGRWGLRVLVGLPWEQHVTFLDDWRLARRVAKSVRDGVRSCAGHPAVLGYAIGNEIPASIVRWHGHARVERFIKRLYGVAKTEDPDALVTYVSYPSTEYLELPFLDFVSFNVYLETEERLDAYLARLQNIAEDRPLLMAEVGLDSIRNGPEKQAEVLEWQVRTALRGGCAGAFVFSWTDEWSRGGLEIEDWAFGITSHERTPKPALAAVQRAFDAPLLDPEFLYPFISVLICTYNGSRTIRECLDAVTRLDYPTYEVIVVNDGSTDDTPKIVEEYDVKLVSIPNGGLSHARNVAAEAAKGEIVAYIDDDAFPDRSWLAFLALAFTDSAHAGIGGPNIPPAGAGPVADCVAASPGGPCHVLHSDREAEHIPGCNMAFRKDVLDELQGFDTRFHAAGDDVDLCWRILDSGRTIGFEPGAMVWHHRRDSVRAYLRQQRGYGKAEAMLEVKWPEKYNRLGHPRWSGRLYGKGHTSRISLRPKRIYHGIWGSGLFQRMYASDTGTVADLTLMPEWFLVILALGGMSIMGVLWSPLLLALPLLGLAVGVTLVQAGLSAWKAQFPSRPSGPFQRYRLRLLTGALHVLQPLARLWGRLVYRLTPFRLHGAKGWALPLPRRFRVWRQTWRQPAARVATLEEILKTHRVLVRRAGHSDRWDLQAECGLLGGVRIKTVVEEHGQGKQLLRLAANPRLFISAIVLVPLVSVLAVSAWLDGAVAATCILGAGAVVLMARCINECGTAMYSVRLSIDELSETPDP